MEGDLATCIYGAVLVPTLPKVLLASGSSPDSWIKRNANLEMLNAIPACAIAGKEFFSRGEDEDEDDDGEIKDTTKAFLCVRGGCLLPQRRGERRKGGKGKLHPNSV